MHKFNIKKEINGQNALNTTAYSPFFHVIMDIVIKTQPWHFYVILRWITHRGRRIETVYDSLNAASSGVVE